MGWFKSFAPNHAKPKRLPADQIERALDKWCQPLVDNNSGKELSLSPQAIHNVRNLLSHFEDPVAQTEWSRIPRIFTILRAIHRLDAMRDFVDGRYRDDMLPLNEHELPQILESSKVAFMRFQPLCLTQAAELEKGESGRHVQFGYNGDIHFYQIKELGSGGFGRVDHVWSKLSYQQFARKKFLRSWSHQQTRERFNWFEREIGALKRLSHRHLVRIKGTYADPHCFAFLMEPVAECNLQTYLDRLKPERLSNLRNFFGCLASAVTYLHKTEVYHMDIKLLNILVKRNQIYLTDFGAAHDWSQRDRSTTWAASPRTVRYMAPEQASDANAPKNYSVDIWSLGVVFLEMTTVLRGASIKDLYAFMSTHGTKGAYAYNNLQAAYDWLDRLRSRDGPDYDNLPMMWVRDMLMQNQYHRPHARKIQGQILSAQGFCGSCCAFEHDQLNDFESPNLQHEHLSEEGSVAGFFDAEEQYIQFEEDVTTVLEASQTSAIQSWIDRTQIAVIQPKRSHNSTPASAPNKAPAMKSASMTATTEELPFDIEEDGSDVEDDSGQELVIAEVFSSSVPARLANLSFDFGVQGPQIEPQSGYIEESAELAFDIESDDSGSHTSSEMSSLHDDVHASKLSPIESESDSSETFRRMPVVPVSPWANLDSIEEEPDIFYDTEAYVVKITPLSRDNADEVAPEVVQKSATMIQKSRSTSEEDLFAEPEARSQLMEESTLQAAALTMTKDSSIKNPATEMRATVEEIQDETESSPGISRASTLEVTPSETAGLGISAVTIGPPMDQTTKDNHHQRALSEKPLTEKIHSSSPKYPGCSDDDIILPKSRVPLTTKNLKAFGSKVSSSPKSGGRRLRPDRRMSAKKYMQQICQKPSEAATSVMSERTRNELKGLTLTVWMDKSSPVLDQYVKKGSAAAVRYLINAGCNPGTKQKPRIGPLLAAVKGASLRHNKCADSLLRAGADVNVRTSHTGKTMLSLAIEHQDFPGYRGLIWTLLHWGANPNIKDKNGDYPLLQILYNGYDPLEEHKRQALALILQNSKFPTDVNVEPPGTLNKPLHLAARRKDPWAVGMLLEKGARPNDKNGAGQTPFAVAVSTWARKMTDDHKEVARLLVEAGIEVNEPMGANKTPALHSAIRFGHVDLVNFLVNYGADPQRKSVLKENAYSVCEDMLSEGKLSQSDADEIKSILDSYDKDNSPIEATSSDGSSDESTEDNN